MICTIYSNYIGFDKITDILQKSYPKASLTLSKQDEFQIAEMEVKGGFFSSSSKLKVGYRQRVAPSYQLLNEDDCPLSRNLKGLYGYINSLPTSNEKVKDLFLHKIQTINCEFSVIQEQGTTKDLKNLILNLAQNFDAFLFVQPNTIISKSGGQHFLDRNLNLIIDGQGNCEISNLNVEVDAKYFENEQVTILNDQRERRAKSEEVCISRNIPVYKNQNSLFVESEETVKIRTKQEVVDRAIALCYLEIKSENAEVEILADLDKKYNVLAKLTPNEKVFALADNPTEQQITEANWRAESYHVLLWALGYIENLDFPSQICNIGKDVSYLFSKTESEFSDKATLRTKTEILDQADLILRLNWACVSARIKNQPAPGGLDSSVVYERHYALNWLTHFQNQDWDSVTTPT